MRHAGGEGGDGENAGGEGEEERQRENGILRVIYMIY